MRIENMDSQTWSTTGLKSPDVKLDIKTDAELNIRKEAEIQEEISLPFGKGVEKLTEPCVFKTDSFSSAFTKNKRYNGENYRQRYKSNTGNTSEKLLDMFASMLEFAGLLVDRKKVTL